MSDAFERLLVFDPPGGPSASFLAAKIAEQGSQALQLPLTRNVSIVGSWRCYFHRLNSDGLPWCVSPDAGGWEIAVRHVEILVPSKTIHHPKDEADDEDGRPSAWIAADGVLTVDMDGHATIEAAQPFAGAEEMRAVIEGRPVVVSAEDCKLPAPKERP